MDLGVGVSRFRCAMVWGAVTGVAVVLLGLLLPVLDEAAAAARAGALTDAGFEPLLVWGCAGVAAAAMGWLWLVTTLVTLDAARGKQTERRGVPVAVRSVLLGLCGVALTTGLAGPALASADGPAGAPPLAGLRLPERIGVDPLAKAPVTTEPPTSDTVVVTQGDTLWAITAERLGPGASDDEISASWPVVYALNRDLIGPDPGLIEPGQRLVLPRAIEGGDR